MDDRKASAGLTFAAVILIFAGLMRLFDSIWAFSYTGQLPNQLRDALFGDSLTAYGWWWLFTGAVLIGAGFAVLSRSQLGRWTGVVAAVIGGLGAITWMPYYPIWSFVYVLLAVVVIYSLIMYGAADDRTA
jgi:hypothetical protein